MKLHYYVRRKLRVWAPAVIGILVMAVLGLWLEIARYFLFTHHAFWMISAILLINPVAETFWPASRHKKRHKSSSLYSIPGQQHAPASPRPARQAPKATSETAAERLAHLRKEKAAVERKIAKVAAGEKEQTR